VPHSYFTQFYIASVLSSAFWGLQLFFRGCVFQAIASRVSEEHRLESMSLTQIMICWLLLAMQGSRRLWECFVFAKPSTSKMWFVHWLLGLGFYLAAGVAIWIEGSGMDTLHMCKGISLLTSRPVGTILTRPLTIDHVKITNAPSVRTFFCVPLFLIASGMQHDCHHFLFSLKKYTLPDHPIFRGIVCPHYGAECVIYLSLAILAAPPGQWVNKTMLSCLAFVAVNLGLTAQTTKQWYMQKFNKEAVQDRWLMIPYVY
jgi:3-oxo-5-alpha-steroid 4-dehydrogenase 3